VNRTLAVALALALAAPLGASASTRVHTVKPGETLWTIARTTVGDGVFWPALYAANRDRIKDPARVYPGQQLEIPHLDEARRAELRREARVLRSR
jgi:nucleoid-associated protein YgaU